MAEVLSPAVSENRCVFRVVSSANYRYVRPARHVVTYVRLLPPRSRGLQRVADQRIQIAPLPQAMPETVDRLGNRVFEARHEEIGEHMTLIVELKIETGCQYDASGSTLPTPILPRFPISDELRIFSEFTDRTRPSLDMVRFAESLRRSTDEIADDPFAFATRIRDAIHSEMTFKSGSTHVGTVAAEAWDKKKGVCQDFSHITLATFRQLGVAARYVSGFVPGEGVMHAWVEVFLPHGDQNPGKRGYAWFALDPTYDKWVTERYITVAVGRDYADVTPTSGTYYGGANTLQYGTRVDSLSKEQVLL